MRIHRLSIRDVKGVTERDVAFPDAGVLVVEGPNEAGKTTMVEALDMLLDHKDSSARVQIRDAKPVDRDAAPFVEVEMSTGPYRFTYRKQWLKGTRTELHVHRPRTEHLTGVPAHERVRAMLAETADLDLWRALRHLQADPLAPCDLSGSTALASALDAAAGSARDAGSRGESILAAAEEEYLTYFTAKAGLPTRELRLARDRLATAEEAAAASAAALAEVAGDVARHAALRAQDADLRFRLRDARVDRDARAVEAERVGALVRAHEEARGRCAAAERELERATGLHAERTEQVTEVNRRQGALAAHVGAADACREALDEATARLAGLQEAHRGAAAEEDRRRAEVEAAELARERERASVDLARLREQVARADAALVGIARARRALAETPPVTAAGLAAIEGAARAVDLARGAQQAGSAQVEVAAGDDGGWLAVDGERVALGGHERWSHSLGEPVELELAGGWRIRLSPAEGAAARAGAVAAARRDLAELLLGAGAADVDQARAGHDRRRAAQADLDRAETELAAAAAGTDVQALRDRCAALAAELDPPAGGDPPPPAPADLTTLRSAAAAARSAARQARARWDEARLHAEKQRVDLARAESLTEAGQEEMAQAAARLDRARATTPDDALAAGLAAATACAEQERRARDARAAELEAADADTVGIRLRDGEETCASLERRRTELAEERVRIEARLEHAGSQGRHERHDAARTDLEAAARDHGALVHHAEAARLLRDTLWAHSRAAKRAYVAPFRAAIDRLGRLVYGPTFAVEVADDLTVLARALDGRRIPFAALSSGAKEQLAILTRLACASIVDPQEGVPVVIDDALGYSDPERLRRMCAAFGELGSDAQVLLLTCTPGRYAAVADADVVRI